MNGLLCSAKKQLIAFAVIIDEGKCRRVQGQWADGDHLPGSIAGPIHARPAAAPVPVSGAAACPHVHAVSAIAVATWTFVSMRTVYEHRARSSCGTTSRILTSYALSVQDSDELWTLSPPAQGDPWRLSCRNSSDASVRTSGNISIDSEGRGIMLVAHLLLRAAPASIANYAL